MIFSSLLFIYAFLPLSLGIYYISPQKIKTFSLLIISAVFCGTFSIYLPVFMAMYAMWNYAAGLAAEALRKHRPLSVLASVIGIAGDIAVLVFIRTDLFSDFSLKNAAVPVGSVFFTLSAIGYIADVCFGKIKPEHNFSKFLLYIIFFPKLLMGPIVSYSKFSRMLGKREKSLSELGIGLTVFIKGLAKKVLFADNLFILYSSVSSMEAESLSALSAWLGVLAYMLCLYFTISGISDMGTGLARCFGFRFTRSFNYPTFSMGINDYCSRWHIPLVRWFSRYIVKPITDITSDNILHYAVFIMSWGVIGLCYEFSPGKLIWGILIGTAAVVEQILSDSKTLKATAIAYTFAVTSICMVFFMGGSLSYSFHYLLAMFGGNNNLTDPAAFYLLKSYVAVLLVGIYVSTDLFRNLVERTGKNKMRKVVEFTSPIIIPALLAICTALISYNGASEIQLFIT